MMKKLESNKSDLDNGKTRQRIGEGKTFVRSRRKRRRRRVRKSFGENRTHFGVFNNGDLDKKKLQLYVEAIIGESGGKQN